MKAPTDKSNDIIQIEVTRKCSLFNCSNCTRLLPFRKDTVEMSVDVFRQALRSLEGWPGVRAMFGGTPCSHSRYPDLCQIMMEEVPDQRQRGLWTNSLRGHGEITRQTFYPHGRLNLNAHCNAADADEIERWLPGRLIRTSRDRASWHSSILLDYRDYGLSDAEWVEARENCDINRNWSACIVERDGQPYAWFCEVASALDGVRGENNGILAEPGWWRFKMDRFEHQVRNCCDRGCGVPLRRKGQLDTADTYDASKSFVPLTLKRKGRVEIVEQANLTEPVYEATDYQRLRAKSAH